MWPEGKLRSSEPSGRARFETSLRTLVTPRDTALAAISTDAPFVLDHAHSPAVSPLGGTNRLTVQRSLVTVRHVSEASEACCVEPKIGVSSRAQSEMRRSKSSTWSTAALA